MKPMEGIRVLELTTFVAAPVCGRLLADMGAQVIKVERLTGDDWRETGKNYNPRFSDEENPVFDIYNSGKRCVSIDLKTEDGMAAFHKLLQQADVFITNTRPQALKRLGLAYEDIRNQYPRLIYAMLVGFGEEGPDAAMPAFDVTAFWARSGFLRDMSEKREHYKPVMAPFGAGDTVTGMTLFAQVCAALFHRERTGEGDFVRSSLYQNGIFTMGTMEIITQKPWGREFPRTCTEAGIQGYYQCADGEWVLVALGYAPTNLPKIFRLIGRPELISDVRFASAQARNEHMALLRGILEEGFSKLTSNFCLAEAKKCDLPLVRLNHFADVTTDEQAWVNGYLENVTFRDGNQAIMPRSPLNMESLGELHTQCAPTIGWDTEQVLKELGYSDEEISRMQKDGSIRLG